ncbi:MAG: methyl-accepting chemotaxis protein [Desulfonatronovibrionaceae bacterium]
MKNVKLSVKLIGGFLIVALITMAVGITGWMGAVRLGGDIHEVGDVRLPSIQNLLQVEVNIEKMMVAQRTLMSESLNMDQRRAQVEKLKTARESMLEQWEQFKALPATDEEVEISDELDRQLEEWMELNEQWLALNQEFEAAEILDPTRLVSNLRLFRGDHYQAEVRVADHIYEQQAFEGDDDPTACNFGKWLARTDFDNSQLVELLEDMQAPHDRFHQAVHDIQQAINTGNMNEAQRVYQNVMQPASKEVFSYFDELLALAEEVDALRDELNELAMGPVYTEAQEVMDGVEDLVHLNEQIAGQAVQDADSNARFIQILTLAGMVLGTIIAIVLGSILTLSITRPLYKGVQFAKKMAAGDFSSELDIDQKDEVGSLARALNEMVRSNAEMFRDINNGVNTLASSSTELNTISEDMAKRSEGTASKANSVATAAEEMSSNMNSVAAAMEQASTNVSTVASSSEEMSATISEIAENSERAKNITNDAVQKSQETSKRVNELGNAASEISKVTESITAISSQTNLLALNATIEAARAGEAGKGFAVVANEIKELAQQTASATDEIKGRIQAIQDATGMTVSEIEEISQVINDIDSIISTIAAAVEEQSTTTRDIAENVGQAASGIQEVNENVSQSSSVAGEIAREIAEVNNSAGEISNSSAQVRQSADELSKLSERLKNLVSRFKV